jgi:hypothetical protein
MTPRDLFISHSSEDAEVARALRAVLEEAGYSCWMAPDDIVGTDTWTEQILGAIADSKAMIVLVSTASNRSPHVSREVNLALGKDRPVLPLRIEDVAPGGSLEYLLSLVQRVDAFPPPVSVHRDRILRRLDTIVERPAKSAAPGSATAPGSVADTTIASTVPPPPPPAIDLGPAAPPTGVAPPRVVVTPTSVEMPGLVVAGADRRSGPPLPLVLGGVAVIAVAAIILGGGFLNRPGPSPTPSAGAIATGGPATATPSSPAGTVAPTAVPLTAAEQQLQDLLPLAGAGTEACTAWPTPPGGENVLAPGGYATSKARLTCPGPRAGGTEAQYVLYSTRAELDADYKAIMTSAGVESGGACSTAIPANSPWSFPTYPNSGELACFTREGGVQYVWTQYDLRVLAQWLAPDNATGYANWQRWTTSLNAAEQALLAELPASVRSTGGCVRAADRYYETALAIIACPRTGLNSVFYAHFADTGSFPDDPLTATFDSIMTGGGFPDDTTTGCYDETPVFGRYTWGYQTGGVVGDDEGYVGCYERTDTTPVSTLFAWTFNRSSVLGIWTAPDLATGIAYVDDWAAELR